MHNVVADPADMETLHRVKMEMAMALLLLGHGIDRYQHLDGQFHEQVRMIVQCLKSESSVDTDENAIMSEITALHCQMAEQETLLPLATEMKGNLQQVELNLNVFFSDSSKRNELAPLRRLLTQVYGGLYMLSLDTAKQLIAPVQQAIDRYINGVTPSHAEMNAIASAVSSLENYVHAVSQGLKPDEAILKSVLLSVETDANKADQTAAVQEAVMPTGVSVREGGEDAELLEVFLEEAHEVLETLHQHLGACQRNPHSREDLITIRRGFHTLKGSGRMVGLTNLGEVAWSVEKALNKWLQDEKPTSLAVLELIGDAEVLFQHWVEKLRSGGTALIDATALVAAAQRVESGQVEEKESVAKPQAEAELPDIVIGGVSLSPVLFSIATDEAASIIETLQRLVLQLRKGEQEVINYDFVRAAHTLAGVNRSTGFTDISDLASALELWLQVCLDAMIPPDILQLNLLEQSINALAEMVNSLRRKQEPKPRPDLITRLQIKKKQLNETLENAGQPGEISLPEPEHNNADMFAEKLPVAGASLEEPSPLHEEEDLVAYVQRVAQEQASEPLQWQSPEEPAKPAAEMPEIAVDSNLLSIDLSDLHLTPDTQPQAGTAAAPVEPPLFNFDDMGFTPEVPADAVGAEPVVELESHFEFTNRSMVLPEVPQTILPAAEHAQQDVELSVLNKELDSSHDSKKRAIHDDLDEQLLPIFLEEADELYPQLTGELGAWRGKLDDIDEGQKIARKLQRSLHTLKGSARMAGAMRLGELTHRVEDCLDAAVAEGKHDAALMDELEGYFDRIGSALEKLRTGDTSTEDSDQVAKVVVPKKGVIQELAEQTPEAAEERKESAVLRIRSDVVDDLVNEAGEISVARSRMEVELSAFKGGLMDLTGSVQGLRKLVREIEMHAEGQMQARSAVAGDSAEKFDPLEFDRFTRFQELTRFMSESVHDVQTVQQSLLKNLDETSAAMSAQAKLNSVLQQSLMSIRMLPFSNISQRLYRIVRQTCKELGKKANLELYGTEIELDRGVLEKMTAPFEHLLRNAIVHGLESPEQRELKGKPPIGNIALTLRQEGNEVVFEFKDDGAGLNTVKIRQKAVEQGLIKENEVISDEKAMLLIFETGLSTATELTEISGRGVGMDVVRSEIKALGGRVEVSSEQDKGTGFTIYLPLTLAVMKALMVRAGTEIYAIPSVMVEQVQQTKPDDLVELYRKGRVEWQNKSYPLYYLPHLLGDKDRLPDSKMYNSILLLRSGDQRIAIHLDELLGNKEVVVKNVGAQLARLPGIAGATVQANGKVVLILNPVPLMQETKETQGFDEKVIQEPVRRIPVVMIVDDSLTVRKITTRLLTRAGYEVVTAKDGVDALEKLVDITPDVMLLDVEMPRMDGFELTKQLRRDSKTSKLPIIMITSRTADKHRDYAFELGVNEYLGKPYQDNELLENIARFAPLLEPAVAL
jgi:chemosensory pili system protein ChpA (sensor histidine kinase/response regulator)